MRLTAAARHSKRYAAFGFDLLHDCPHIIIVSYWVASAKRASRQLLIKTISSSGIPI